MDHSAAQPSRDAHTFMIYFLFRTLLLGSSLREPDHRTHHGKKNVGGERHLWDHWNPYYGCGACDHEKSGTSRQNKGDLTHVRAAKMRKALRSCFCGCIRCSSALELALGVPGFQEPNPSPVRLGPPFIGERGRHSGTQEVERACSIVSLSPILQDKMHLMHGLGVPSLYRGRERGPSRPSPLLLASTRALASDACGAM